MNKVFGVKEAVAAGEFATTKEQKRTVIAVVNMLGIAMNLGNEVEKLVTKFKAKITKKTNKTDKLTAKVGALKQDIGFAGKEVDNLTSIQEDWDV